MVFFCGQTPMDSLTLASSFESENPLMYASPAVGFSRPVSMEMVVLFPAPLCPSKQKIWLSYMVRLRWFTAYFLVRPLPNVLTKFLTRMIGTSSAAAGSMLSPLSTTSLLRSVSACVSGNQYCLVNRNHGFW